MSGENERLWQTLDIGNMFVPTLASKIHNNFNIRNNIMVFFRNPLDFYLSMWEEFALPYTSQGLANNLLSDWICVPLLSLCIFLSSCYLCFCMPSII